MINVKFANHYFKINNKYQFSYNLMKNYFTNDLDANFKYIEVSDEEILRENSELQNFSKGYLESLAIYRKITEYLINDNIILFHSSAIAVDDKCYLITAPSGTGKSTHARLYKEYFKDRMIYINDDKPLLEFKDNGDIICYGTPYAGKDNIETNTSMKVYGILVISQGKINKIERVSSKDSYPILFNQTYRNTKNPSSLIKTMDLVSKLSKLNVYHLACDISYDAVLMSYNALSKDEIKGE